MHMIIHFLTSNYSFWTVPGLKAIAAGNVLGGFSSGMHGNNMYLASQAGKMAYSILQQAHFICKVRPKQNTCIYVQANTLNLFSFSSSQSSPTILLIHSQHVNRKTSNKSLVPNRLYRRVWCQSALATT